MAGLKIRVPDAPLYKMFPEAVGANPTPIAFAEVYLALQTGTVDAQENPLPTIQAKKFYEVQKHIALTGHITDALLTIVSGQTWDSLEDADKEIFTAVPQRGGRQVHPGHRQEAERARRLVRGAGGQRRQGRPRAVPRGGGQAAQRTGRDLGPGDLRPAAGDPLTWPTARRPAPTSRSSGPRTSRSTSATCARRTASCSLVFWALAVVVFLQFFTRYVLNSSLGWTEEIARYLLIAVTFLGSAMAVRKRSHIAVEFFYRYFGPTGRHRLALAVDACRLFFYAAAAWLTGEPGAAHQAAHELGRSLQEPDLLGGVPGPRRHERSTPPRNLAHRWRSPPSDEDLPHSRLVD